MEPLEERLKRLWYRTKLGHDEADTRIALERDSDSILTGERRQTVLRWINSLPEEVREQALAAQINQERLTLKRENIVRLITRKNRLLLQLEQAEQRNLSVAEIEKLGADLDELVELLEEEKRQLERDELAVRDQLEPLYEHYGKPDEFR